MLVVYCVVLWASFGAVTGVWTPYGDASTAWFAAIVAALVFRLLSSPFFVRPSESLAAALGSALLLSPLEVPTEASLGRLGEAVRLAGLLACVLVTCAALAAIGIGQMADRSPRAEYWRLLSVEFCRAVGTGSALFVAPALMSILWFVSAPGRLAALVTTYMVVVVVEPFERAAYLILVRPRILAEFQGLSVRGGLRRFDSPALVRVAVAPGAPWDAKEVLVCCTGDGEQLLVLPLFEHQGVDGRLGTGFSIADKDVPLLPVRPGEVCAAPSLPKRADVESRILGLGEGRLTNAKLIGFVVENSSIEEIRIEVLPTVSLREGSVCVIPGTPLPCYFQITDGVTAEESFAHGPGGKVVARASQLGQLESETGFRRMPWVADMNTPVFGLAPEKGP